MIETWYYRMPPPATIYGHICSSLEEWIRPDSVRFSYTFSYMGRGDDLEHIHVTTVSHGKVDRKLGFVKNIEAEINPILREILLFPRLTLYLFSQKQLDQLYHAFRSPRYPVILGRSQDLAAYRNVSIMTLERSELGYFEKTLLPWSYRTRTMGGTSVLMPKFIDPEDRSKIEWERYVILEHWVPYGIGEEEGVKSMVRYETDEPLWIDSETAEIRGMKRAVVWHSFV
jgi:CRISPR-associated protein Cas5t